MPSLQFRAGVVTVVSNSDDLVLAFERSDVPGSWQLPQGGVDVGETPREAAWRELGEETGLGADSVDLIGEHPDWIVYEFPDRIRGNGRRLGQAQRWFRFRARHDEVVPTPDGVEFIDWKWVRRSWLIDNVVEFRREAYRRGLGS